MNRKVFEVNKERLVFVSFNEINGRIRQLICVVIALFCRQRFVVLTAEGMIIGSDPSRDRFINPYVFGSLRK